MDVIITLNSSFTLEEALKDIKVLALVVDVIPALETIKVKINIALIEELRSLECVEKAEIEKSYSIAN